MAVIWGLDLREMQWGKFKNSYMWNKEYHLRRTKFIVYQIAMICCVVSESLGTAVLSDYIDNQDFISTLNPAAKLHNNVIVGIGSYNIFVGIFVATIFGSAFFFDLFWPERQESRGVKIAWRICSVLACMLTLSCALVYTYIVATRAAYITGVRRPEAERLLREAKAQPLRYRENGRSIASVVFLWPGMIATFASTALLWHSIDHIDKYGPKSTHARGVPKDVELDAPVEEEAVAKADPEDDTVLSQPASTHARPEGDRLDRLVDQHQQSSRDV